MSQAPAPPEPPQLGIRLVSAYGETTRRVDVQLVGSQGVAVEDGTVSTFEAARLWPTLREVLPPLDVLRADPAGLPEPPRRAPGEGWDQRVHAMVTLAVVPLPAGAEAPTEGAVRTWFATEDELWSATPQPDGSTDLRPAAPGALADLLVWDVTGALESLVEQVEAAS